MPKTISAEQHPALNDMFVTNRQTFINAAAYDEKTKKGTAWAIYDPAQATPAQLIAAIKKLGYEPAPIGS